MWGGGRFSAHARRNHRSPILLPIRMRAPRRFLLPALVAALTGALAPAAIAPAGAATAGAPSAHAAHRQVARHASFHPFLTGLGDQQARMFANPLYRQLHTKIVRYVAPYDAVAHSYSLDQAIVFIRAAEAAHEQVLVAFYHSEYTPTRLPSVALYKHDVEKFIKRFPRVHQYEAWDESNRGNVPRLFSSPSASATAQYYQALIRVCKGCTAVGLDVLDAYRIEGTLAYIAEFKREIGRLRTVMPRIWGLHDYSDVNRLEGWRTREIVRAFGGQVWLTETGGVVKFGNSFPNIHGSGLKRAAKVLGFMFNVAAAEGRIARLYIYDWNGGTASTRFDAGLTNVHEQPREGYVVVCKKLHGARCNVRTAHS
jgi:hypothetical protein